MTANSLTTPPRNTGRIKSLFYSVFVLTVAASAIYFLAASPNSATAKKGEAGPAPVLATTTFPTNTALPAAIPDNNSGGVNLSVPVSGLTDNLRGVSVNISLTHTWVGDLNMTLTAPGGAPSHLIFSRTGATSTSGAGDSSNLAGPYTFGDGGTGNWWTAAAGVDNNTDVPAGSYRTSAPLTGLATEMNPVFQGPVLVENGFDFKKDLKKNSPGPSDNVGNGTWTLNINDNGNMDIGQVTALSLTITTLAPTAASAEILGRVITSDGQGIPRASVTIINTGTQDTITVMTNQFGYFKAIDLPVGNLYTMTVGHKEFQFPVPTQAFTLDGDIVDALFISKQ